MLRILTFFIVLTLPTISWANSTLNCTFSKYKGDNWVSVATIKSWIPENQNHRIKNGDKVESILFGWQGNVSKDTPKRIEFSYPEQKIEYIYFRTSQKAVATFVVSPQSGQRYKVWGKCDEIKQSSSSSDNKPDTNFSSSKLDKAKSTCKELGFELGTEKHGDCVLKLMEN